jgi:hypothetical protein
MNPSLNIKDFEKLNYKQYHLKMEDENNVWSVRYRKSLNPHYYDEIEVHWFCGTCRYSIYRQTQRLQNIPLFEGFLRTVDDLLFLETLFDLTKFYEPLPKQQTTK